MTDATVAEVELEAVRAAGDQATSAPKHARLSPSSAPPESQFRAKADTAAEEIAAQLTAAPAGVDRPKPPLAIAETDRDTAVKQAGQDAASPPRRHLPCTGDRRRARRDTGHEPRRARGPDPPS